MRLDTRVRDHRAYYAGLAAIGMCRNHPTRPTRPGLKTCQQCTDNARRYQRRREGWWTALGGALRIAALLCAAYEFGNRNRMSAGAWWWPGCGRSAR